MIELKDKYFRITTPRHSISITWWPLTPRVLLVIDGTHHLSFRASREIYDRVINPLINGEGEEIAEALIDIARRFRDARTHEKYVEILTHFGVREMRRWLRRSPKRYFFRRVAEVAANGIAGVRREWGSVFVAPTFHDGCRPFAIILGEEPKICGVDPYMFWSEHTKVVLAVKVAEEGIDKYQQYFLPVTYQTVITRLLADMTREVAEYLYADVIAVKIMLDNM